MTDQPQSALDRLFNIAPTELTDDQLDEIIAEYRKHFGQFQADEAAGKRPRKPKTETVVAPAAPKAMLSNLGLRK
jgi:hypothetical protein